MGRWVVIGGGSVGVELFAKQSTNDLARRGSITHANSTPINVGYN